LTAKRQARFPTLSLLLAVGCIIGFLALLSPFFRAKLLAVEYWTSDWRTAVLSDRTIQNHSRIAVVLFDPASAPGRTYLPVPRDYHARVIQTVDAAGAALIGLDFYFLQPTEPERDRAFVDTIKNATALVVVGAVNEGLSQFNQSQFAYQKQFLADLGRPAGDITFSFDHDKVVRHAYDASKDPQFSETFAGLIAKLSGARVAGVPKRMRIGWLWGPRNNPYPFLTVRSQELLSEQPRALELQEQLKGKIVLIGLDFPYIDRHRTPLSVVTNENMLGVMVHAQMIAQLLDNRLYSELSLPQVAGFLAVLLVLGLVLGWIFWTRANLLGQGIAAVALVSLDAVSFYLWRTYLPLVPGLYVWFLAVLAGSNSHKLALWFRQRQAAA
jgi:adenylate cyclase